MTMREGHRLSRRRFLGAMGASAGAAALTPGGPVAAQGPPRAARGRGFLAPEHFGRIFRLPPFAQQSPKVEAALRELGKPGGLLDAKDPLKAGPKQLIVDLSLSADNPNNPTHTAGTTFFGQFLDHDMTFDADSQLAQPTDPQSARNYRTPSLDLDSVYGAGPVAQQELYDPSDHVKLQLESGGLFEDLPRRADGTAIVGDPRNDENLIIAGLHCAFAAFHNRAVDHVRGQGLRDAAAVFEAARRLTTWHYHWLIVTEFLPQIVGRDMLDRVLGRGRRLYTPARGEAFMPVEFQTGTYRMGHSMVRPSYRANLAGDDGQPFFAFIFDPSQEGMLDPDDLRGGVRARAGSSAGRPSSTSATARSSPTSRWTLTSRRLCSTCPSALSPATTSLRSCLSETCCASSPGAFRRDSRSRPRWASAHCRHTTFPNSGSTGSRGARHSGTTC